MVLFKELFGTFAGQLSLAVILFIIGMAVFFGQVDKKKAAEFNSCGFFDF